MLQEKWRCAKHKPHEAKEELPLRETSLSPIKTSLSAEVSVPLAHRLFSGCFAESKLIHHKRWFRNFTFGGWFVHFQLSCKSGSLKQRALCETTVLQSTRPRKQSLCNMFWCCDLQELFALVTVLCSEMLSASSSGLREAFAEIVVRLISFIVNQAGARACSTWNLQQTSSWPWRVNALGMDEHGAVWYTYSFYI